MLQVLLLHRVLDLDPAQDLRRETRQAGDADLGSPSVSVSPILRLPWFGMPMMSPGHASSARLRSRARKNTGFCTDISRPVREFFSFMPRRKRPEHDPHKGDAVAVLRVDIGLHLEDETGDRFAPRARSVRPRRRAGCGRGGGARSADPAQQFAHPEIVQRAAEKDRRQMALRG